MIQCSVGIDIMWCPPPESMSSRADSVEMIARTIDGLVRLCVSLITLTLHLQILGSVGSSESRGMGHIFSKHKKRPPHKKVQITDHDRAVLDLKNAKDRLKKYQSKVGWARNGWIGTSSGLRSPFGSIADAG
jgi:hypothetical protein